MVWANIILKASQNLFTSSSLPYVIPMDSRDELTKSPLLSMKNLKDDELEHEYEQPLLCLKLYLDKSESNVLVRRVLTKTIVFESIFIAFIQLTRLKQAWRTIAFVRIRSAFSFFNIILLVIWIRSTKFINYIDPLSSADLCNCY